VRENVRIGRIPPLTGAEFAKNYGAILEKG
jgi:hypothetical protein